jgi:hypothetical protein
LTTSTPSLARLRLAAATAVCAGLLCLGLSACGGGGDDGSSAPAPTSTSTASSPRGSFDALLRKSFAGALGENQADCMVAKLHKTVSDADIEQSVSAGQLSEAVIDAAQSAAISCANAGG